MSGGPVGEYLDQLRAGLRTAPARTAEIVAEAEDHLRESAAARQAAGLSEDAAGRAAIAAFGPVRRVIRAHRPPASAYALAAGLQAWPLLAAYLLLSAGAGAVMLWVARGASLYYAAGPLPDNFLPRSGYGAQVPLIVGCVLAGVLLLAGYRDALDGWGGDYPIPAGVYGLFVGGEVAALVFGLGCATAAFAGLTRTRSPAAAASERSPGRAAGYAVAAATQAGRLLAGYLLLTALLGGLRCYTVEIINPFWAGRGQAAALLAGCALAGGGLIAAQLAAGRRYRRHGLRPVTLSREPKLLLSAAGLLAVAACLLFGGDVMSRLHTADGVGNVILASQDALLPVGLYGLVGLVRDGRRRGRVPAEPVRG